MGPRVPGVSSQSLLHPRLRTNSPSGWGTNRRGWTGIAFRGCRRKASSTPGYERTALRAAEPKRKGMWRPRVPGVSSQSLLHPRLRTNSPSGWGTNRRGWTGIAFRGCRRRASSTPGYERTALRAAEPKRKGMWGPRVPGVSSQSLLHPRLRTMQPFGLGNQQKGMDGHRFPGVSSQSLLHPRLRTNSPSGCRTKTEGDVGAARSGGVVAEPPPPPATNEQPFGLGVCRYDLRGLDAVRPCPECGTARRVSAAAATGGA